MTRKNALARRAFLTGSATAASGLVAACAAPGAQAPDSHAAGAVPTGPVPSTGTHVVTLGTAGGPAVRGSRKGIATGIVVDGELYLVDSGLGVVRQLTEAELPVDRLRAVLLTHLHSDHIAELPALLLYNWGAQIGGFSEPFPIIGPGSAGLLPRGAHPVVQPPAPGTGELVRNLLSAYAYDINVRTHDEARPPLDDLVVPQDIALPPGLAADAHAELAPGMEPFEIHRDEKVRISASLVHHPPVFPSYGFRIETPHGVVALSGDTSEHPNVVGLARDADLLVHEGVLLAYYEGRGFSPEFIRHLGRSHTDPAGAGRVAAEAGARHLVLSHLGGAAPDDEWTTPVAQHFGGSVTVAADGQVFSL